MSARDKLRAKLSATQNARSTGMNPLLQRAVKTMDPKEFNETQDMYKDMGRSGRSKKCMSSLLKSLPADQMDQLEANVNSLPSDQANQIKHFLQNRRKAGKKNEPVDTHVPQIYVPRAERDAKDVPLVTRKKRSFAKIDVTVPTIQQLNESPIPPRLPSPRRLPLSLDQEARTHREKFSPETATQTMREAVLEANTVIRFGAVLRAKDILNESLEYVIKWVETLQVVERIHFFNVMAQCGVNVVEKGPVWTLLCGSKMIGFIKIT